jgi:hypothetical protein
VPLPMGCSSSELVLRPQPHSWHVSGPVGAGRPSPLVLRAAHVKKHAYALCGGVESSGGDARGAQPSQVRDHGGQSQAPSCWKRLCCKQGWVGAARTLGCHATAEACPSRQRQRNRCVCPHFVWDVRGGRMGRCTGPSRSTAADLLARSIPRTRLDQHTKPPHPRRSPAPGGKCSSAQAEAGPPATAAPVMATPAKVAVVFVKL